jgi:hypothetical protein
MMKAIKIDSATHEISVVEYADTKGLHDLVGGFLEIAWMSDAGDVLFVDEEALMKPTEHFFRFGLRSNPQPMGGHGVIVGRELVDKEGEWIGQADPGISVARVTELVQFLTRAQAEAWGRGNASEPAVTMQMLDRRGRVTERKVIARYGELFGQMPKPEKE